MTRDASATSHDHRGQLRPPGTWLSNSPVIGSCGSRRRDRWNGSEEIHLSRGSTYRDAVEKVRFSENQLGIFVSLFPLRLVFFLFFMCRPRATEGRLASYQNLTNLSVPDRRQDNYCALTEETFPFDRLIMISEGFPNRLVRNKLAFTSDVFLNVCRCRR